MSDRTRRLGDPPTVAGAQRTPDQRSGDQRTDPARSAAPSWDGFAPFYDQHVGRLYRLALLLCAGHRAAAEDAVTRAFVQCYEAWTVGDVPDVPTYARQALVTDILAHGPRQAPDDVADESLTFTLLEGLPVRQRVAVVLRYFEDLSYDEMAAAMDVTIGTVKSDVATGLQRIREQSPPPPG